MPELHLRSLFFSVASVWIFESLPIFSVDVQLTLNSCPAPFQSLQKISINYNSLPPKKEKKTFLSFKFFSLVKKKNPFNLINIGGQLKLN